MSEIKSVTRLPSEILADTKVKQCRFKWYEDENTMCAAYLVWKTIGFTIKFTEDIICAPCAKRWKDVLKFNDLTSFLVHYNDLHRLSFDEIKDVCAGIGY